jgi:hypothetical protein
LWPTIPQPAQLRLAQIPRFVALLSRNHNISSATWSALFDTVTSAIRDDHADGILQVTPTSRLCDVVLLRRKLLPKQRHAALLFPWENYGLDEENGPLCRLLLSWVLTPKERRLLLGRLLSPLAQEILVEDYQSDEEFQLALFAYCQPRAQVRIASLPATELVSDELALAALRALPPYAASRLRAHLLDAHRLLTNRPHLRPEVYEVRKLEAVTIYDMQRVRATLTGRPPVTDQEAGIIRIKERLTLPSEPSAMLSAWAARVARDLGENAPLWCAVIDFVTLPHNDHKLTESVATARSLLASKHATAHG